MPNPLERSSVPADVSVSVALFTGALGALRVTVVAGEVRPATRTPHLYLLDHAYLRVCGDFWLPKATPGVPGSAQDRGHDPGQVTQPGHFRRPEIGPAGPSEHHSRVRIAERRGIELLDQGKPVTEFMKFGDRVRIEMLDAAGRSVFGAIDQRYVRAPGA